MKRISFFIVKSILVLIALHILAVLVIWYMNVFYVGAVDEANVEYLGKNASDIDLDRPFDDMQFDILKEDVKAFNLFLLGENHGVADVQKIDRNLFLSLHREHGVRYYVAEMDSSLAFGLNCYLSDPDKVEENLGKVVIEIKKTIPQQSSKELFQKWSKIYDYNRNLPDSLKIKVIGIDKNRDDISGTVSRDEAMFNNFVSQVKINGLQKEKFYGLFGYAHTLQSDFGTNNYRPFAAMAKESKYGFANKVVSLVCYTLESDTYFPKNEQYPTPPDERTGLLNADGPITLVKGINDLEHITEKNSVTIFNLKGKNSPYRTNQDLAGVKVNFFGDDVLPSSPSQVTTDFFQYVILTRGSKALTAFDLPNG